jgi:hypothetical protein
MHMEFRRRAVHWGLPHLATLLVRTQALDLDGGETKTLWALSTWRLVLAALASAVGGAWGAALARWLTRSAHVAHARARVYEHAFLDGSVALTHSVSPSPYQGFSKATYIATLNHVVDVSSTINTYARSFESGDLSLTPLDIARLALLKKTMSTRSLFRGLLCAPCAPRPTTLNIMDLDTLREQDVEDDARIQLLLSCSAAAAQDTA